MARRLRKPHCSSLTLLWQDAHKDVAYEAIINLIKQAHSTTKDLHSMQGFTTASQKSLVDLFGMIIKLMALSSKVLTTKLKSELALVRGTFMSVLMTRHG